MNASHNFGQPNTASIMLLAEPQVPIFFSFGMDALRLGPYMRISCSQQRWYMDTLGCSEANPKQKTTNKSQPRRPANLPARFAFRQKNSKPDKQRAQSPKTQASESNDVEMAHWLKTNQMMLRRLRPCGVRPLHHVAGVVQVLFLHSPSG